MSEKLPGHQIGLYLEEGDGWNMNFICYYHEVKP